MKRPISLKWFLTLSVVSLLAVLVIGYSLLATQYFIRGVDSIVASNMERAALNYLARGPLGEHEYVDSLGGYQVARAWRQLPAEVRRLYPTPPERSGEMVKRDDSGGRQRPATLFFMMRYEHEGETLFVVHSVSPDEVSQLMRRNVAQSMDALLGVGAITALALAVILWLLFRRVARPVVALGQWTRTLEADKLETPAPDFSYPELNQLAELIRTSLSSVQEALQREHRFLRHASHELRTPISVVRNNVELIQRLQQQTGEAGAPGMSEAMARIDRASLTMKHLTETLLWLSRDENEPLPVQLVQLDALLHQVVAEAHYLLAGKTVTVDMAASPSLIQAPQVALHIVLGNLIRNAFQHTWQGLVTVRQEGNRIEIINRSSGDDDKHEGDTGFGLGLALTEQLARRLGWQYENRSEEHGHHVTLVVGTGRTE